MCGRGVVGGLFAEEQQAFLFCAALGFVGGAGVERRLQAVSGQASAEAKRLWRLLYGPDGRTDEQEALSGSDGGWWAMPAAILRFIEGVRSAADAEWRAAGLHGRFPALRQAAPDV